MEELVRVIKFCLVLMFIPALSYSQIYQEVTYVIPSISGLLTYNQQQNIVQVFTYQPVYGCGDSWDSFGGYLYAAHGYLSFGASFPQPGYHLQSASLNMHLFQFIGNDVIGVYPIFNNMSEQYEPPCLLEHVDYGNSLNVQDINTPNLHPGDVLLNDITSGWISHDITAWVLDDIDNNNRSYFQIRIRLQNNSDWDIYSDGINFHGLDNYIPYIKYIFEHDSNAIDDEAVIPTNVLSCYPNPFRDNVSITYKFYSTDTPLIEIYNLKGQRIKTIKCNKDSACSTTWDGFDDSGIKVTPGVYLVRLQSGKGVYISKLLYLD